MKYSYLSDSVKVKKVEEKGNRGEFHIEGLYTGYGVTIANSLRRALLSSLPGAAISQIKVKGVKHEFSTIPGVVEDMVEFILNLKKIRFEFNADEPQVLKLKVKDAKEIKAGDIESTTLVEVVNKDLVIAHLSSKKSSLEMEVTVEKGLGYVPAENRKSERLPVGTIMLDCIFSPIVNVEFDVENMRVGERTDYNKIKIIIETDGSITPSSALQKSTNILRDHFLKIFEGSGGKIKESKEKDESSSDEDSDDKKEKKTKTTKKKKKKPKK
ncbi:MAG: DNA-directed RNA polymerase subunit alpha [Candidatus Paceibacterota bacterium]